MNPVDFASYFRDNLELDLPPIPSPYENKIKLVAKSVFGSANPEKLLYNLDDFLNEVVSKPVKDYVVMGIAEKGEDTVCYYAVKGPLALFVQLPLSQKGRINNAFAAIKPIFDALEKNQGKIEKDKRLLVVFSHYRGSGCQWITGHPGEIDDKKWDPNRPLLQALNALSQL